LSHFITDFTRKYVVLRVRLSYYVRHVVASCCHFIFKCIRVELRGRPDHSTLISNATYSPWRVDNQFCKVLNAVASHTLLDKMRLYELWQLATQVRHLEGHAIEIGCWQGGAGCMIANRIAQDTPNTMMFLCDTFPAMLKAYSSSRVVLKVSFLFLFYQKILILWLMHWNKIFF
jgi:hypothetical protein